MLIGYKYLDFPDYAQFLTGEREADTDFYSAPADKMYGMNRQVWKLKEYELPVNPADNAPASSASQVSNGDPGMIASGTLSSNGQFYPTSAVTAASMSTASSSSSSFYEPLTEGKWRDGWLPPAESLQWRFPDDCGDELEIVESIVVDSSGQLKRNTTLTESSRQGSLSSSSMGGDDEDSVGWEREKIGLSGRLRGRLSAQARAQQQLGAADAQTEESVTPVGLRSRTVEEDGTAPREIPVRTSTNMTSPRSPDFDTTLMPNYPRFGGRRKESGMDEYSFEDARRPSLTDTEEVLDKVDSLDGGTRVVEKVSRYVRWDPHVAWAKQAIWGSGSSTGGKSSGHSGKSRGAHSHSTGASKAVDWAVGKVRRQIRDILIFGEVSTYLLEMKLSVG